MKVLVTGVSGFIGSALSDNLVSKGFYVLGTIHNPHQRNSVPKGISLLTVGSIEDFVDWETLLTGVDAVIHLAGRAHVIKGLANNSSTSFQRANVEATRMLATMAARAGVRRFIFISSVKVNGEGRAVPYSEADKPAPLDPYGISKWEAEQVLYEIAYSSALEVTVLRPPLVYGPGVKANFLRLLEVVEHGIPLPLGGVNNRRSLIYIGNLVSAITTCLSHPKASGQTFLVSDGEDISTPELIRRVATALGRPARLFSFPPPIMRLAGRFSSKTAPVDRLLRSLTVDSSKIRSGLNWTPAYTMAQGLKETAVWYKWYKRMRG